MSFWVLGNMIFIIYALVVCNAKRNSYERKFLKMIMRYGSGSQAFLFVYPSLYRLSMTYPRKELELLLRDN